jgi:hypothetical protein
MESEKLDKKIDRLQGQFESPWSGKRDWKALWSVIKEISADFKGIRYPSRDERTAAWTRFQSIVERIKESHAKEYEERHAHREQSVSHLCKIQSLADSAGPDNGLGELVLHLATGGLTLITKMALDALLGKSDEEFQGLHGRSESMKNAWAYLSNYKAEMTGRDKATAYALLEKTKERLDSDWERWKAHRQDIIAERNRQRQAKQEEREAKHQEWRTRQRQFIERLEGAESKLEAALSHRQEHLAKLIGQYESAWSAGYRERVEGWIEEERGNIVDIESKLENVRAKLSEARLRLDS